MNNISPVAWVNKYPYVALEHVYSFEEDNCTHFIENAIFFQMVMEHKICNVRGGDFCKIELSDEELEIIEEWVKKSEQVCYKCKGLYGSHLAKDCPLTICYGKKPDGSPCGGHHYKEVCPYTKCWYCNQSGHYEAKCPLKVKKAKEVKNSL